MSNYIPESGDFIKANESSCGLVKDRVYQILSVKSVVTLVGITGVFTHRKVTELFRPTLITLYGAGEGKFIVPEYKSWFRRLFK